jgi:hypothetical protein
MRGGLRSRLNDARGTSLVEAALVTPLLLLLTLSILDFSVLFYTYLALENGVSQATRFAVTGNVLNDPNNPANQLSRVDSIKLAMRNATPTLTIDDAAFTFDHMAPGGNAWAGGTGAPGDLEKLSISYPWTFINPMLWPFFNGGQITLKVDSAMKNESRFQ